MVMILSHINLEIETKNVDLAKVITRKNRKSRASQDYFLLSMKFDSFSGPKKLSDCGNLEEGGKIDIRKFMGKARKKDLPKLTIFRIV